MDKTSRDGPSSVSYVRTYSCGTPRQRVRVCQVGKKSPVRAHYELAEQTDRSSPYDLLGRRQRRRKSSTKKRKKGKSKGKLVDQTRRRRRRPPHSDVQSNSGPGPVVIDMAFHRMTNFRRSTGVDRIYIVSLRLLSAESLTHAELGAHRYWRPFFKFSST